MYSDLLRYRYLDQGYKQMRAKLGMRRVRPWKWLAFTNPARRDGLVLHHWRRQADEGKDYPFAKFNKSIEVPTYTEAEYQHHLLSAGWSRSAQGYLCYCYLCISVVFTHTLNLDPDTEFRPNLDPNLMLCHQCTELPLVPHLSLAPVTKMRKKGFEHKRYLTFFLFDIY